MEKSATKKNNNAESKSPEKVATPNTHKNKNKTKNNNENNEEEEEEELEDVDLYSIVFLTGNQGKLKEVKSFFDDKIGSLITNKKLDLDETQGTPKEIINDKLFAARKIVGSNVSILVEDTSLILNAYAPAANNNANTNNNNNSDKNKSNSNEDKDKADKTSDFLGELSPR